MKTYTESREDLLDHAKNRFEMIDRNIVKPCINQEYALKDAAMAHEDMEARKTSGSSILIP
jgi:NADPH2:quinone reductase